jgi:hypothetical protein
MERKSEKERESSREKIRKGPREKENKIEMLSPPIIKSVS